MATRNPFLKDLECYSPATAYVCVVRKDGTKMIVDVPVRVSPLITDGCERDTILKQILDCSALFNLKEDDFDFCLMLTPRQENDVIEYEFCDFAQIIKNCLFYYPNVDRIRLHEIEESLGNYYAMMRIQRGMRPSLPRAAKRGAKRDDKRAAKRIKV